MRLEDTAKFMVILAAIACPIIILAYQLWGGLFEIGIELMGAIIYYFRIPLFAALFIFFLWKTVRVIRHL